MSEPRTLDVGALPPGGFGSRSLMFWGTIEAIVMAIVTVLFAINGPSIGMFVGGFGALIIVSIIVLAKIVGGK